MHRPLRRAVAVAAAAPVLAALVAAAPPANAATVPSVTVADLKVTETNAPQTATLTLRLSARSASSVSVKVATAAGTATAPADFTAVPLTTVTFSAGQTAKTVAVKIAGDTLDEYDEKFRLVLSSPVRAVLARTAATVTVVDNDAAPALSVPAAALAEGSAGLADRTVNATLSAVSGKPVTLTWETVGGTAASGVDYEPADGRVTIPAGATSRPLTIAVDGDQLDEPDERFYVRLTSVANASYATSYHRVTLTDDDAPRTPVLDRLVPDTGTSRYVTLTGAAESDATVRFYDQGFCDGEPIYTASGSRLGSGGVTVQARENAITVFSARAVSPRGELSACSSTVSYWHDSTAPAAPLVWAPSGPANDNAPLVKGSTEPGGTILLFYGTGCAGDVAATGSTDDFMADGVPVPVGDDTTTWFSARARDAVGNVSACGASSGPYVEDSSAPAPVGG